MRVQVGDIVLVSNSVDGTHADDVGRVIEIVQVDEGFSYAWELQNDIAYEFGELEPVPTALRALYGLK